jgi:predicted nucleotidyltransferase
MRRDRTNLENLRVIAAALGDLRERVVFVGGATAALLISDPAAESVRATKDVDAIVDVDGLPQYQRIERELAQRGFRHDVESGIVCRWIHGESGVVFDLMPVDAAVLGFSNPWYAQAVATAERLLLGDDVEIRLVAAPAFVATKLAAFADRGNGDILASHDVEDVLNIVDGRPELSRELENAPPALRDAVREAFSNLLRHPDFLNGLPGLIAGADRAGIVVDRLREMSA